ncbi:MAG: phytanoyl-CoA dioxygenase family protein [Cytophagales bacterium]|nr:phytanoyl-CoA dioxygenase family protein [Cytophagales bacterium]
MIRRIKMTYMVYNFFHKKQLVHNKALYKKIGLKKCYFSPISSVDFQNCDAFLLNQPYPLQVNETKLFQEATPEVQQSILDFPKRGYTILSGHFSPDKVDAINQEIENLLNQQEIDFKYRNKLMFAIHKSKLIKDCGDNNNLIELLSALRGSEMQLFQSINFLMGSEQKTHSDSIHMTTFPLGGLLGVWVALEDIDEDNGPLHYYEGSHTLPYFLNPDYNNEGNFLMIGDKKYTEYEIALEQKIKELGLKKKTFKAKKGDVLIWHANLLHGGEAHENKDKTRKSMVFHYFDKNAICYHEVTQRPTLKKG